MKDYIHIGSSPPNEDCVQLVERADNSREMQLECRAYIAALRRYVGIEPLGALLRIKRQEHDFGTYYEVVCEYDDSNKRTYDYALQCEGYGPPTWSDAGMKVTLVRDPKNKDQVLDVVVELDPKWTRPLMPGPGLADSVGPYPAPQNP